MGIGEIAHYEQFLFFPQCFQKACFPGVSKGVFVWEWVNSLTHNNISDVTKSKAFAGEKLNIAKMTNSLFDREENTAGKGENAGYQHFLLFPCCFSKPSSLGSLEVWIVW